jgi:hypothetical protein
MAGASFILEGKILGRQKPFGCRKCKDILCFTPYEVPVSV